MRSLLVALTLVSAAGPIGASGCASSFRGTARSDDTGIADSIARKLAADPRLCPYAISVAVHNHTARLQGKVSSEADRRRAHQLAREGGAAGVEDMLQIDPAAAEAGMC
jgi:osmotically-inducible protein OsmY